MEQASTKCPDCDFSNPSLIALSVHYRKRHKHTAEQLRILLFHGGVRPTCLCGCGGIVRYLNIVDGFSQYVRGHQSRVKNNWGHNTSALRKSQDTRRIQIVDGTWISWNKGQSAENDDRVRANNIAISQSIMTNPEERAVRAERLREGRLHGSVPTLRGPAHSQWKGGASALQPIVRARLHSVWTYPKLKASGFKCHTCGAPGPGLEVHHDGERFAAILQKAIAVHGEVDATRPDDDFERKDSIAAWVADYHTQNDVTGTVLCVGCHEKAHEVHT